MGSKFKRSSWVEGLSLVLFSALVAFSWQAYTQVAGEGHQSSKSDEFLRQPQAAVTLQDISVLRQGQGLISASQCTLLESDESPFRVVQYTGSGDSEVENIRNQEGAVIYKVPNFSLMYILEGKPHVDRYSYVEVIGTQKSTDSIKDAISTLESTEIYEGYVFNESLLTIENHVIEVVKSDEKLFQNKPATQTYWMPKESNDRFLVLDCPTPSGAKSRHLVFEVYDQTGANRMGLVALDAVNAEVFKNIKVRTFEETRAYFQSGGTSTNLNSSSGGSAIALIGADDQDAGTVNKPSDAEESSSDDEEYVEDDAYDEDVGESDNEYVIDDVPLYEGNMEYIICTSQTKLNVRPFDDVTTVLFEANRYEQVIPMESFNNDERFVKEVDGTEYTFLKVQFPDRNNQIGWIAESFISERSRCVSYQQRLGDDQPIICTQSGGVNVRDENLDTIFQADQFEPVALRSDYEDVETEFRSGNDVYQMIPVTFINRGSEEGWIAKDFVKKKKECPNFNAQESGCCNFPFAVRPTHDYTEGMRRFGANRRSKNGGTRLHAGVDLYSKDRELVYAVDSGTVRGFYKFYYDVYAIEVTHNNFIVRYGEVLNSMPRGVKVGAKVRMGQQLGWVWKIRQLNVRPMLHFEMYSSKRSGSLSGGGSYKRRSDLKNPTSDLRKWERKKFGTSY